MKTARDELDIINAYEETGSLRAAAALCGTTHKTVKRVLNTSYDTSLSAGFEVEGHAYEKLRESGDYKEGIAAFTEKRKPNFTGA